MLSIGSSQMSNGGGAYSAHCEHRGARGHRDHTPTHTHNTQHTTPTHRHVVGQLELVRAMRDNEIDQIRPDHIECDDAMSQ
jgi:hypothetical protein